VELVKQIFSDVVDKLEEKEITKGNNMSCVIYCNVVLSDGNLIFSVHCVILF
jgi:hypothetical protein